MENKLKISVVTVTWNSVQALQSCLNSVANQSYINLEHIVVDGVSTDGTLDVISKNIERIDIFVSERDCGIYDALNKGFKLATGDVVGILHSDDIYYDNCVLHRVANEFKDASVDYVYGDIQMINDEGCQARYWKAGPLPDGKIVSTQIPHPSLFISRKLIQQLSPVFDSTYKISADLKQQIIFANILRAKGSYVPLPLVKMRIGGTSTKNLKAYMDGWKESRRAWNEVHGFGGGWYVIKKVFSKLRGLNSHV
jgi:glycosyltransferase involved in cell wall biosynthesis